MASWSSHSKGLSQSQCRVLMVVPFIERAGTAWTVRSSSTKGWNSRCVLESSLVRRTRLKSRCPVVVVVILRMVMSSHRTSKKNASLQSVHRAWCKIAITFMTFNVLVLVQSCGRWEYQAGVWNWLRQDIWRWQWTRLSWWVTISCLSAIRLTPLPDITSESTGVALAICGS